MPYRKRIFKRKTFRKNGYKRFSRKPRKGKYMKQSVSVIRGPTTVPDKLRLKLSYNSYVSLAGTSGVPFDQVYQNSLFDPDLTGAGNQPLGFDQWAAFYNKYRVNGMSIKVQGASTNTTNPLTLVVYPSLDATAPATVNGVLSTPYARITAAGVSGGNAKIMAKGYMSTKKIWGFKRIDQEDDFAALVSGTPNNLWFWHVYGYSGSGNTPTFQGYVKITFYCEFFEREQLNIS